jgi:hypothetical protein
LRCAILSHKPDPIDAHKRTDGEYVGFCRFCGTKLRRVKRGKWKAEDWL